MGRLKIGVFTSIKEAERRVPLFPDHLLELPEAVTRTLYFERGYGHNFNLDDSFFELYAAGMMERAKLLSMVDLAVILKPTPDDLSLLSKGSAVCGWAHCVQQHAITAKAIERELTVIALENMHYYSDQGKGAHLFFKNNEIAGEVGVYDALLDCGYFPCYGKPMSAAVLSFGAVGRGAVHGLQKFGVKEIVVFSRRPAKAIPDQIPGIPYFQMVKLKNKTIAVVGNGELVDQLNSVDIIVNAIAQNTDDPWQFLSNDDVKNLKRNAVIIDISCDKGLGFEFAHPTSFAQSVDIMEGRAYYSVDHIPSRVWRSASHEISKALLGFWPDLIQGPDGWDSNITIRKAIDIQGGVVINPKIINYRQLLAR